MYQRPLLALSYWLLANHFPRPTTSIPQARFWPKAKGQSLEAVVPRQQPRAVFSGQELTAKSQVPPFQYFARNSHGLKILPTNFFAAPMESRFYEHPGEGVSQLPVASCRTKPLFTLHLSVRTLAKSQKPRAKSWKLAAGSFSHASPIRPSPLNPNSGQEPKAKSQKPKAGSWQLEAFHTPLLFALHLSIRTLAKSQKPKAKSWKLAAGSFSHASPIRPSPLSPNSGQEPRAKGQKLAARGWRLRPPTSALISTIHTTGERHDSPL